jgi:hypothetical protein
MLRIYTLAFGGPGGNMGAFLHNFVLKEFQFRFGEWGEHCSWSRRFEQLVHACLLRFYTTSLDWGLGVYREVFGLSQPAEVQLRNRSDKLLLEVRTEFREVVAKRRARHVPGLRQLRSPDRNLSAAPPNAQDWTTLFKKDLEGSNN